MAVWEEERDDVGVLEPRCDAMRCVAMFYKLKVRKRSKEKDRGKERWKAKNVSVV